MTTQRRKPLTAKRIDAMFDLMAILESVQCAGWEGTPADTNNVEDGERVELAERYDDALEWLTQFLRAEDAKRQWPVM